MNILNRIKTAVSVLTHRHCFCLTYNRHLSKAEISQEVLNAGALMSLANNWSVGNAHNGHESLSARADMVKAAFNDRNVIMATEHYGKYYIIRDCESADMVDTLNNLEQKE